MMIRWSLVATLFCTFGQAPPASAADPGPGSGPGQAWSRAGNVLFRMPDGWRRADADGPAVILRPADVPHRQLCELRILPPERPARSLRHRLERQLAAVQARHRAYQGSGIFEGRSGAGTPLVFAVGSAEDGQRDGAFHYWAFYFIEAGDLVQPIEYEAESAALFNRHKDPVSRLVNAHVRFASQVVLADGRPPLTRLLVEQTNDFLEWVLDAPMTRAQRDALERHMIDTWKAGQRSGIDGVLEYAAYREKLAGFSPDKVEIVRAGVQEQLLPAWRKLEADPLARMLVGIYDAAHKPLAAGEPPLTRQAADATLELLYFMASVAHGCEPVLPPQAHKDQWADKLAAEYPRLPAETRKDLADSPVRWAVARVLWAELPVAEKEEMRRAWSKRADVRALSDAIRDVRDGITAAEGTPEWARQVAARIERGRAMMAVSQMSFNLHMEKMACMRSWGGTPTTVRYTYRW